MKLAEADQVRGYALLTPVAKERVRFLAERSRITKGTDTALERRRLEKLVTGIEKYEVSFFIVDYTSLPTLAPLARLSSYISLSALVLALPHKYFFTRSISYVIRRVQRFCSS
jgi:hypothetical protein